MAVDPHERTGDPTIDWRLIREVTDADLAFPAEAIDHFLPPYDYIPEKFKDRMHPYRQLVETMWGGGLPEDSEWDTRDGIDGDKAFRQIRACMGSYQPSHQHKEAGVAYLIDNFFKSVRFPSDDQKFEGTGEPLKPTTGQDDGKA